MRLPLKKARHAIARFASGHYNLLLMLLFWLFVFRPYEHKGLYIGVWKVFLTTALMMAIFTVHHTRVVKIIVSVLAIPAVGFSWLDLFNHGAFVLFATCISNALFMVVCAGSILNDVILRPKVTMETLKGVICAYFLIAFIFAYAYLLIEAFNPGSILVRGELINAYENPQYFFAIMLYYSFVTFLTIGYGDIVAIKDLSQTACVIEGILGQFYIAILVARLVSVYSFFSDKRLLKVFKRNANQKS